MTELERRALLGDKKAQKECTEKGIVLPCPKCFKPVEVKKYDDVIYVVKCKCGLTYMPTSMEEQYKFPKEWNTRQAPPIGRCDECERRYENEDGVYCCSHTEVECGDDDYCSYFEPRCEE